jgi:hypothetical protein
MKMPVLRERLISDLRAFSRQVAELTPLANSPLRGACPSKERERRFVLKRKDAEGCPEKGKKEELKMLLFGCVFWTCSSCHHGGQLQQIVNRAEQTPFTSDLALPS